MFKISNWSMLKLGTLNPPSAFEPPFKSALTT
jgi:hypothetical protein